MTEREKTQEPFVVPLGPKEELLCSLVEPVIEAEGCQLVDIELVQSARTAILRLYVDNAAGDGGVVLEQLTSLNRLVGDMLDVEDEHRGIFRGQYHLECSSPGVDRPLTKRSHFTAHRGERVKVKTRVKLAGARAFSGVLAATSEEGIRVRADGSAAETPIAWRELESAHTIFQFEEKSAPKPKRSKKKGS